MYMKRNFSKTVCGMIAKGHHMCVSVSLRIMYTCLCAQISPIMSALLQCLTFVIWNSINKYL